MSRSTKPIQAKIPNSLTNLHDDQLVLLRASLDVEMRKRKIAFTVGAVGERLAIEHFRTTPGLAKLQAAPRGTKNVDALSRSGDRYSVKTVCNAKKTGTIYPDADSRNKQLFEHILIVKLAEDWSLKSIHQIAWSDFVKIRSWDKRMNAWYVSISARALGAASLIYQAPSKNA